MVNERVMTIGTGNFITGIFRRPERANIFYYTLLREGHKNDGIHLIRSDKIQDVFS